MSISERLTLSRKSPDFFAMKILKILFSICFLLPAFCGLAETYTIPVGQFEKLKVNGNIDVVYRNLPDSTGFAQYEAPSGKGYDKMFQITNKSDGSVKVEPADNKWGKSGLPVIYIYSDFLTNVESASERTVEIESLAPCASFSVSLIGNGSVSVENIKSNNVTASINTGNGQIYLSGICINANYKMVGAGLISADLLKAENVKCRVLGTGSIGCWPYENLNVTGLGSTKIYYKGEPQIKKKGSAKLYELPEQINNQNYDAMATPVNPSKITEEESIVISSDDDYDDEDEDDDEDDEDEDDDDDEEDYETVVTQDD